MQTALRPENLILPFGSSRQKKRKSTKQQFFLTTKPFYTRLGGLKRIRPMVILLDKNKVCQAIVRGRVTDEAVDKLIQLAIELQSESMIT